MRDVVLVVSAFAVVAMLAVITYQNHRRFQRPMLTTAYQAVTLANEAVFHGRLDHPGSDHSVLRHAFSIRTELDPRTQRQRYMH